MELFRNIILLIILSLVLKTVNSLSCRTRCKKVRHIWTMDMSQTPRLVYYTYHVTMDTIINHSNFRRIVRVWNVLGLSIWTCVDVVRSVPNRRLIRVGEYGTNLGGVKLAWLV